MQAVNLRQGTTEWHQHRATHYNASDAPAMLGESPYKTRTELVKQYATGIVPDVDPAAQRRFDDGHRFEELARPLAEKIIGETLYPITGVLEGTKLSASFDGLTMLEDTAFEHKTLNDSLRHTPWDEGNGWHLPLHYQIQMEQQLMVSGAERVLFVATKWADGGTLLEERHCWYASDDKLHQRIIAGWAQFEQDVEAYRANPPAEAIKVQAEAVESLPAVAVQLNGTLSVVSNLDKFGTALRGFIGRIPAKPTTDQEFANAEAACKMLKQAEDALDSAEGQALAQISDVEQLRRTVADLKNLARTTRLATDKLVKAEKENRRAEIARQGVEKVEAHYWEVQATLGEYAMRFPDGVRGEIAACIKGLKSLDSMQDKVVGIVLAAKLAIDAAANAIRLNMRVLADVPGHCMHLFPDRTQLCNTKTADDLRNLVKARLAEYEQREAARQQAERERIEAEAKAEREAVEKLEAERQRIQEAAERLKQEQLEIEQQKTQAEVRNAKMREMLKPVTDVITAESRRLVFDDAAAAEDDGIRIKLGQINDLMAPLAVTAAGLASLGFEHVGTDKAAKLYREVDLPAILESAIRHLQRTRAEAIERMAVTA